MVLPWLIVGASAALQLRHRAADAPTEQRERELRRMHETDRELRKQKTSLEKDLKDAADVIERERAARTDDQDRLQQLERIQASLAEKVAHLNEVASQLSQQNSDLQQELAKQSEEFSRAKLTLENEFQAVKDENLRLTQQLEEINNEDRDAILQQMMQELRESVAAVMTAFTSHEIAGEECKSKLADLGIHVSCSAEQLQLIQHDTNASAAIESEVTTAVANQLSLVLDDRSRLEHLMGIAMKQPAVQRTALEDKSSATMSSSNIASERSSGDAVPPLAALANGVKKGGGFGFLQALGLQQYAGASSSAQPNDHMIENAQPTSNIPKALSGRNDHEAQAAPSLTAADSAVVHDSKLPAAAANGQKKINRPQGMFRFALPRVPQSGGDASAFEGDMVLTADDIASMAKLDVDDSDAAFPGKSLMSRRR